MNRILSYLILGYLLLLPPDLNARTFVATGSFGAVSTGHPVATKVALNILERGGNAVDASVAAAFVLGVVDPSNSGLGGDGHALIRLPFGKIEVWDAASRRPEVESISSSGIGLPTEVPLLLGLHEKYGSMSLVEIISPSIKFARNGIKISSYFEKVVANRIGNFKDDPALKVFAPEGRPLRSGEILKQPDLASTLMKIAQDGGKSFLRGEICDEIVSDLKKRGAGFSIHDLADYQPILKPPVSLEYGNWQLVGVPPPASPIVVFAIIKKLLDGKWDCKSLDGANFFLTTLREYLFLKHHELAKCLGNPRRFLAFSPGTLSREVGENRFFDSGKPERLSVELPEETTHLVVWDKNGMIVNMTITLGVHFGTGDYCSLGFFYNSQKRNFRNIPKNYPLNGGSITAKSPILAYFEGKPVLALGGAGADRIIGNVAYVLAAVMSGQLDLKSAVHAPRLFVDSSGSAAMEWGRGAETAKFLKTRWKNIQIKESGSDFFGLVSAVANKGKYLEAVGDFRRDGDAGALAYDPDSPRKYKVELFAWKPKGMKKISVVEPVSNERQKIKTWKSANKRSFSHRMQGPNKRLALEFPERVSAVRLEQIIEIFPGKDFSMENIFGNDFLYKEEKFVLGDLEMKFIREIPENLTGRSLVEWLLVKIGHEIPFKPVPGKMTGETLLQRGAGDCSGKARLMRDILVSKGVPCRLVGGVILKEGYNDKTHIWNEVYLDNRWTQVCTVNHIFGRIPSNWLVMRYGDTTTLEGKGRILFRTEEL